MIIRALTVFEREAVRKFYLSLSPDDRRKRFCCTLSDDTISGYVDRVDFTRDTILGAFDEQAKIVGLAELVRGTEASEMAFSVRPDKRGQKIGTKLIQKLMLRARLCGIAKVFVMFLSDNTPMRRMATRAGMALSIVDGEAHAERELQAPSAEELAQWFMEEGLSRGEYVGTLGMVGSGSPSTRSANTPHETLQALTPAA
ncbi:MAG: GNAT family N-acetyltransferase [Burkholderiales bacterium]|nr:GNAT family N-acetyltransferase [Burkholderiales bacterium]